MKKLTLTVLCSYFVFAMAAQMAGASERHHSRHSLDYSRNTLARMNSPEKVGTVYPTVSNSDVERYHGIIPMLAGH